MGLVAKPAAGSNIYYPTGSGNSGTCMDIMLAFSFALSLSPQYTTVFSVSLTLGKALTSLGKFAVDTKTMVLSE